jgi:D-alanyl-D-alanine carboxypeptidase
MNGQPSGARLNRRQLRQIRKQKIRTTLLSLCIVIILLLVTLAVFLFCAIADELNASSGDPVTPPTNNSPADSSIQYTTISKSSSELHKGDLLLVNNDHYYDPAGVQDPITIDGTQGTPKTYTVAYPSWKLNAQTLNAFNKMMATYYGISGDGSVKISSAYRTAADQEGKATPVGYSDHHTGYCLALRKVDGGYLEDEHWIYENGPRYGFIQRYPNAKADKTYVSDYEYCIRYVGIPHATYMAQNDLCLEEYIVLLRTSYTEQNHLSITCDDGNRYEVYYVPASAEGNTTLNVPQNYAFTVSGDNVSGFIVTVDLSRRLA